MPKLWSETVEDHRRTVHAAILDTTAALVASHGMSVTMSQVAQEVGIGRATLYKYFPDVQAIMVAWHERQVSGHLQQLTEAAASCTDAGERLRTILAVYAELSSAGHGHDPDAPSNSHAAELAVPLHQAKHVHHARRLLHELVTQAITAAADGGVARDDVPATELATYCLHALGAAGELRSRPARERLVAITLAGLRPGPG
ncbi:TetR/AcrR family transcriptional regulator [Couchioplanes caeruleus]|uniref:TetR/AcrR family transcriptional regulator n=1 Tax=Couchioplanes caeruleus TaxID=56438 RepID=UPI0020C11BE5|nr:TetR/AcrR family transcriptional regulator [Couchioplanes caeruleus]UQU67499.1 TetR/AcrR family transcriptional regulator [Couchioplanes caeruleus]